MTTKMTDRQCTTCEWCRRCGGHPVCEPCPERRSAWRCRKCDLWASDRHFPSNLCDDDTCDGRLVGPDPVGGKPGTYARVDALDSAEMRTMPF